MNGGYWVDICPNPIRSIGLPYGKRTEIGTNISRPLNTLERAAIPVKCKLQDRVREEMHQRFIMKPPPKVPINLLWPLQDRQTYFHAVLSECPLGSFLTQQSKAGMPIKVIAIKCILASGSHWRSFLAILWIHNLFSSEEYIWCWLWRAGLHTCSHANGPSSHCTAT